MGMKLKRFPHLCVFIRTDTIQIDAKKERREKKTLYIINIDEVERNKKKKKNEEKK